MKILVDTHTHTSACAHAYSSLEENLRYAKLIGLEAIAITDHGPMMPDSPHVWHFGNMTCIPRDCDGVKVFYGAEANILDSEEHLDIPPSTLSQLDVVVASMHHETYRPGTRKEHTKAYIRALENPYVDIIGHSGSPEYEYDVPAVLSIAKREGKMIEINNNSHLVRRASEENCIHIAKKCMEMGVYVVVSSDAHFSRCIGNFDAALAMLDSIGFPEELVANTTMDKFLNILRQRKLVGGL